MDKLEEAWTERHSQDAATVMHGYDAGTASLSADDFCEWLNRHADRSKALVQLHVHPKTGDGDRRTVMGSCLHKSECESQKRSMACQHSEELTEQQLCKYGYPRLPIGAATVLCKALARRRGLPIRGKKTAIGQHDGPRGTVPLGECHPALAAACVGGNTHVRLSY